MEMQAYLASTFADENGPQAVEGKTIYIRASKGQIKELATFLAKAANHTENNDTCHMHFQDYEENWSKEEYIDLVIDLVDQDT